MIRLICIEGYTELKYRRFRKQGAGTETILENNGGSDKET